MPNFTGFVTVVSVEFYSRYYSEFLIEIPYALKSQTNFVSFMYHRLAISLCLQFTKKNWPYALAVLYYSMTFLLYGYRVIPLTC